MDKNIQYLAKDFNAYKSKLINFAKTYYPTTYNDFSDASPGMMLIEMAAYVGDVLSLYQDNQIQENFLQFSKQKKNLLAQAYQGGYTPKITSVATTNLDIYQLVPSINISGTSYHKSLSLSVILTILIIFESVSVNVLKRSGSSISNV